LRSAAQSCTENYNNFSLNRINPCRTKAVAAAAHSIRSGYGAVAENRKKLTDRVKAVHE
jgi:hypothetical protein